MKEILLRKSISIAAAAAVLIALMIGTAACASNSSDSSEASSAASNIKPAATAAAAPEAKDSKAAAEKAGKAEAEKAVKPATDKTVKAAAEAVTADALLQEVYSSLANANYVAGNTDFAFLAPSSADENAGAGSISYMFESTRSASIVHTSGTVNKDGASIGVESFIIDNEGNIKLLSCRDGKWTSQDDAYESLNIRNLDELTALISLTDYTLNQESQTGPSPSEYTLTTTLAGQTLSDFLLKAGVFSEFPDSTLPESLTAVVTLTVDNATKLPMNFSVSAPAGEDTYGFQYNMLFSSFDNSKTIFVPEEDIAKVIQLAEEKEKEEKEKEKDGSDTTSGTGSSNTWVDVDLTNQIVTLYVDGVAVMSSPCVTGNILNGTDTPTGTYSISYKTTSTYLMNNSYVDYWMPFNGGIGLHDASWRGGNFASTEAWGNGSHGCVNLPHEAAQTIYQYISAGDTVVVHGWPQDPATIHSHDPGEWEIVKEATCKEEGKRVRKCKGCGETVEEGVVAKADHTEGKWVTTKEATEDAAGARELHCAVCDQVIKTEEIPKLNHTHTASGTWETTKNATCEAAGERVQRCAKDGTIVLSEAIPATGHSWSGWTETAATCTENGSRTRSCSACGATQTEAIPAAGHSWTGWTETAATCTENGSRTRSCSVCGATETETTDPATGHSWGEVDSEGNQHCNNCEATQYVGVPESEGSSSGSSE